VSVVKHVCTFDDLLLAATAIVSNSNRISDGMDAFHLLHLMICLVPFLKTFLTFFLCFIKALKKLTYQILFSKG
jgi:hypothetical protein